MKFNRSVYQSFSMIGQFGISMLVPVLACSFLGIFLDKKLGTSCFIFILFFVGAIAGFRNIYRFSMKLSAKKDSESLYLHGERYEGTKAEGKAKEAENESAHSEDKQNTI